MHPQYDFHTATYFTSAHDDPQKHYVETQIYASGSSQHGFMHTNISEITICMHSSSSDRSMRRCQPTHSHRCSNL